MLRREGARVDVSEAATAPSPEGYDGIVVGDAIHNRAHSPELVGWLSAHRRALKTMPSALFQLSLYSAVPRHANTACRHIRKLQSATGLAPDVVGAFGGRLAYTSYGWWTKRLLQLIAFGMRLSTDTSHDADYTDWQAVGRFAHDFHEVAERKRVREG